MEFVVHVLEKFFHMKTAAAQELMLRVHDEGSGVCGVYPRDEAAKLVEAVLGFAREHDHPLQCVMEKR
jgi:ATP-dependent Clp protease adaptor protein ClpS